MKNSKDGSEEAELETYLDLVRRALSDTDHFNSNIKPHILKPLLLAESAIETALDSSKSGKGGQT